MKREYLDAFEPHTLTYFPPHLEGQGITWDGGWMCCNMDYSRQYLAIQMTSIRGEQIFLIVRESTDDRLPRKDIEVTFKKEDKDAWPPAPISYEIPLPRRYYLTETLAVHGIDEHERWAFPHVLENNLNIMGNSWHHPAYGKIIATIQIEEEVFFLKAEQGNALLVSTQYRDDHPDACLTLPPYQFTGNFYSYTWPHEEMCQSHPYWHEVICRFLDLERHF